MVPLIARQGARRTSYRPTAEDRLWLLRAVQYEGEPRLEVARAMVNLFVLARSEGSQRSLGELVRAYSQPVNPKWANKGTPAQIARRAEAAARTTFSPDVVRAVDEALATGWASDVTDFAAPMLDASGKGYVPRSEPRAGRNRLWTRRPGWAGYAVDPSPEDVLLLAARLPEASQRAIARRQYEVRKAANPNFPFRSVAEVWEEAWEAARDAASDAAEAVNDRVLRPVGDWALLAVVVGGVLYFASRR